ITHLLPPEVHGDPLDQGGALCFYHFGWDFVGALTQAGFEDAGLSMFWNPRLGHLGGYQNIITAPKAAAPRRACWKDRGNPGAAGRARVAGSSTPRIGRLNQLAHHRAASLG